MSLTIKRQACRTFPHNWRLAKFPERAMRCLRKSIEGLIECSPIQITLRLCIVRVASYINLISACAEQRRGKQLCDCAQHAHSKIDRGWRGKAQLSRRRLVRVHRPGRRLGARDILGVRLGDDRRVPRCVDFLHQDSLFYISTSSSQKEKITYDKNIDSSLRKWLSTCLCRKDGRYENAPHRRRTRCGRHLLVCTPIWGCTRRCAQGPRN